MKNPIPRFLDFCGVLFFSLAMLCSGCSPAQQLAAEHPPESPEATPSPESTAPVQVLSADGTFYRLLQYQLSGNTLYGTGSSEKSGLIKAFEGHLQMSDVDYIEVEPEWTGGKVLLVLGGLAAMGIIVASMNDNRKQRDGFNIDVVYGYVGGPSGGTSCPFFYTYDGKNYHFESESFAGAVFRGGEYASYDVLEHLRQVDGGYRLRMTNERLETHYVNEVKILAVDAPPSAAVIPDPDGEFHTITGKTHPVSCETFKGDDVLTHVRQTDQDYWESDLAELDMTRDEDLRDGIVLEFEKPFDAQTAKLVINGVNTTLGVVSLEQLFSLRGPNLARWHQQLDRDPDVRNRLRAWMRRVGKLHVSLWQQNDWVERAVLPDVGPASPKSQVAVLDLSKIKGDRLRVRLESTTDLWRIDEVYVDYSPDQELTVTEVSPARVIDYRGYNVTDRVSVDDDRYLVTLMGSNIEMFFDAVPDDPALHRTYALKAKGFYLTWSERKTIDQPWLLEMILADPLAGVRATMPAWKKMKLLGDAPAAADGPTGL